MTKPILVISVIFLFVVPSAAQTHFYLEESFKRPANIPDALLPLLRNEIKSRCRDDANFQTTDVRALFAASRIVLNHAPAFILKSNHMCLTGADNIWFWLFLRTRLGYRKILFGGTISVDVLRTKHHGLRDVETNVATAAFAFRKIHKYNGSVYKARVCSEAEMIGLNPKFHRVSCQR
jgi:hypothetical protein